jgi:hypothetical protein
MGSVYGVYAWLLIAAALFGAWIWFNMGLVFYSGVDAPAFGGGVDGAFSSFLLLTSIASVGMAGVWRKG